MSREGKSRPGVGPQGSKPSNGDSSSAMVPKRFELPRGYYELYGLRPPDTKEAAEEDGSRRADGGLWAEGPQVAQRRKDTVGAGPLIDFDGLMKTTGLPGKAHHPPASPEQLAERAEAAKAMEALRAGTSSLHVVEADMKGREHPGFQRKVLSLLGILLSRPKGRQLVLELMKGSKRCTIRPATRSYPGGGRTTADTTLQDRKAPGLLRADGRPGGGDHSFVELDETVGDHDVKVHDAAGRPITDPVYIILGHELIHARHIGAGTVDPRPLPKAGPNILKEDEITIATGDLTENDLRREHGLPKRHGYSAVDRRFRYPGQP